MITAIIKFIFVLAVIVPVIFFAPVDIIKIIEREVNQKKR